MSATTADRPIDRVAFVTGGSRGIGRQTVLALARAGRQVGFCYSSDADGAHETIEAVEHEGGKAVAVCANVADAAAVDTAFGEIESAFGPVTILVNNAGITRDGLVVRMSDDNWNDVLDTNLTGAFHTIRRATPAMMKARFGRIVNVSSASAHIGQAGQANYAAAKAGIAGMTIGMARELKKYGVTVNAIAPRARTPMTEINPRFAAPDTGFDRYDPANISPMVAFLASDAAADVSAQVFVVLGDQVNRMRPAEIMATVENGGKRWTVEELIAKRDELFAGAPSGIPRWGAPGLDGKPVPAP
jgi:3-oxoacyl-[acyl-carrier protein] reductase